MRLVLSALAATCLVSIAHGCDRAPVSSLSDNAAIEDLSARILEDQLYPQTSDGQCLTYVVEVSSANMLRVAVRELHSANCGGDSSTAPVLDRFQIDRGSGTILRYDVLAGDYVEYLQSRNAKTQ